MQIKSSQPFMFDAEPIDANGVHFTADDGRVMFSVDIGKDGRSIQIRGVDACMVGGVLYSSYLEVLPEVANTITVRTRLYE